MLALAPVLVGLFIFTPRIRCARDTFYSEPHSNAHTHTQPASAVLICIMSVCASAVA